jgi:hypothetical protein
MNRPKDLKMSDGIFRNALNPMTATELLSSFSTPSGLMVAQNLWYNEKVIPLQGYSFQSCRFDNCVIMVGSGRFELINCRIGNDCRFHYSDEIKNILKLFLLQKPWADQQFPGFTALQEPNGNITIKQG